MNDLLHDIIKFHADRLFLDVTVGRLSINYEPLLSIASSEEFLVKYIVYLSLNASHSSFQASQRFYVIHNFSINLEKKETIVKKILLMF